MNWHDYLAIALVVAAAAIVAGRACRALFGQAKAGCGSGCGSCGSNRSDTKPARLLTIGLPPGPHKSAG